ncbi:MAG: hypothetical protein ACYC35_05215 [Pirellulales bacterium]
MSLFGETDGAEPIFVRIANAPADHKYLAEARSAAEALWARTRDYLDSDLVQKARRHFHQCFWEMYLAGVLLDLGLPLVPRTERIGVARGPDILVAPATWIEAVAVTAGTGRDAVANAEPGQARAVPDREMKLRLLSVFTDKSAKFEQYRINGLVGPSDPCVVAINAALVPAVHLERTVPRIIRALLEVGDEVWRINTVTREVIERTHAHQPTIAKRSGKLVSQGMFLDGLHAHVSVCLYSAADIVNRPNPHGCEFIAVHNPTALNPLPHGTIPIGQEYWVEDDQLQCRDYTAI